MKKLNILYLEDSQYDADLVERELTTAGMPCQLTLVDTEAEYREALANMQPDVILSDHTLFQFNSSRALRIFQETGMNIPFILVTGTVSEEFAVSILKEGADDYILKERLTRLPPAIAAALHKLEMDRERKRMEEENQLLFERLQHSEQEYRSLFEQNPDGVFSLDRKGRVTSVNNSMIVMWGAAREDILGKHFSDFVLPDYIKMVSVHFKATLRGKPQSFEIQAASASGSHAFLHLTNLPILVNKEIIGVYGIAKDVTEKQKQIKQINDQITILKDIAWTQSHVVRAPLARMMSYIELIQNYVKYKNIGRTKAELISIVLESAHELDEIVKDVVHKTHQLK